MDNIVFVDRIESVGIVNGVARLNLVVEAPDQQRDDEGNPAFQFSTQIVMPLNGLGQSMSLLENFIKKLEDEGAIESRASKSEEPASNEEAKSND